MPKIIHHDNNFGVVVLKENRIKKKKNLGRIHSELKDERLLLECAPLGQADGHSFIAHQFQGLACFLHWM